VDGRLRDKNWDYKERSADDGDADAEAQQVDHFGVLRGACHVTPRVEKCGTIRDPMQRPHTVAPMSPLAIDVVVASTSWVSTKGL